MHGAQAWSRAAGMLCSPAQKRYGGQLSAILGGCELTQGLEAIHTAAAARREQATDLWPVPPCSRAAPPRQCTRHRAPHTCVAGSQCNPRFSNSSSRMSSPPRPTPPGPVAAARTYLRRTGRAAGNSGDCRRALASPRACCAPRVAVCTSLIPHEPPGSHQAAHCALAPRQVLLFPSCSSKPPVPLILCRGGAARPVAEHKPT